MKVLVVLGAKKNGNTDKLAAQFVKGALSAGHEVETEYLFMKKNIHLLRFGAANAGMRWK